MQIRSTSPDAYMIFYPYSQPLTEMGAGFDSSSMDVEPFFVREDILALSTSKVKGGAASWSVTLSGRVNYRSKIQPGCWVFIYISDNNLESAGSKSFGNGVDSGFKMLGLVRSVRCIETTDPSGVRYARFTISGDDFHSVMDSQVYICPILRPDGSEKDNPIIDSFVLFKKQFSEPQTPDMMVKSLVEAILGKSESLSDALDRGGAKAGGVYGIPSLVAQRLTGSATASQNKFVNVLNLKLYRGLAGLLYLQPELGSLFTLWSMIQTYSHGILNECYTELLPTKTAAGVRLMPSVVLRPIPFSRRGPGVIKDMKKSEQEQAFEKKYGEQANNKNMPYLRIMDSTTGLGPNALGYGFYTSKVIEEDEIVGMNYGKSDSERFNYFFVSSNLMNQLGLAANNLAPLLKLESTEGVKKANAAVLGDTNSMARHGLRPYITQSQYMNIRSFDVVGINRMVRDMWALAHLYENGSVVLVGSARHIPVGTNIEFKERGWIAHVEGVSHNFQVSPTGVKTFRTTINFVRLQRKATGLPLDFALPEGKNDTEAYNVNPAIPRGDYDHGRTNLRDYTYRKPKKKPEDGGEEDS
jgi:hypothetical protein